MHMKMNRAAGFTLIELMIVVGVIAILAAIAVPSYQNSVIKSRRGAAAACLLESAQFMERFYTTKMTYVGAALPGGQCQTDLATYYTFASTPVAQTARAYALTATPIGTQLAKDTKCGTLGINQLGTKTILGTGTVKDCW